MNVGNGHTPMPALGSKLQKLKIWINNKTDKGSNIDKCVSAQIKEESAVPPLIKRSNSDNSGRANWNKNHTSNESNSASSEPPTWHSQPITATTVSPSPPRQLKKNHTISSAELNSIGPYKILKTIGVGSFSIVKLGYGITTSCSYSKGYVALKMCKKDDDEIVKKAVQEEVSIMKKVGLCPYIVNLLDLVENSKYITLVLEYFPNGDLFDFTLNHHYHLTSNSFHLCKQIFKQITLAVKHIHTQGVSHRDLKIENVLIYFDAQSPPTSGDDVLIKLTDFGLAHVMNNNNLVPRLGSDEYLSPEVVAVIEGVDPRKIDVWALGVILYTLCVGELPFVINETSVTTRKKLFHKIARGEYAFPSDLVLDVPVEAKQLISRMLTVNMDNRISVDDVLSDPWLN